MEENPLIEVSRSGIHHKGVFARERIRRGTKVIEYVGEKVTKAEGIRRGDEVHENAKNTKTKGFVYIFELNSKYDIDGNVPQNVARWINHSCEPNCSAQIIRGHIWIIARRTIEPGDELTYNYGYGFDSWRDHPCRCGSPGCIGWIVARRHFARLRKVLEEEGHKRR